MLSQQNAIPKGNTKREEKCQKLQNQRYNYSAQYSQMQFSQEFLFLCYHFEIQVRPISYIVFDRFREDDVEKSTTFFLCARNQKIPTRFFFLTDYLDEEYVDLDWAESTTAESTMISAAEEQEGSGEVGEIDDEDEHEGSSKNEAHLSEIDGSGEFGKKTKNVLFCNFNFFLFHGILNLKNALKT